LNFTLEVYDLYNGNLLKDYGSANSVALADVNGDGKLDLIAACECGPTGGTVSVLLGNGDGTFQAPVNYPSGGDVGASVAVSDLNGDGKPDIIVANSCVSVWLQQRKCGSAFGQR
jgi:FG-GAP-like repeat